MIGSALLVPPPGDTDRAAFLRWLLFIVANVYPCVTFADVPTRFVAAQDGDAFKDRVTAHASRLWKVVEAEVVRRGGPWLLGERFAALNIYLAVMVHWRPGQASFERDMPILARISAQAVARLYMLAVMARKFPDL